MVRLVLCLGEKVLCAEAPLALCLLSKGKRAGCIYIVPRIESVKGFKSCLPVENPNALSNFLEQKAAHGLVSYVPQKPVKPTDGSLSMYLAEAAWVLTGSSRCRWIWIWVPECLLVTRASAMMFLLDRFGGDNWKWVLWLCLDMCRTPHNPCFDGHYVVDLAVWT